ncbi:hypothetical protein [Kiloniella antarctica]|uniref:Uncharacterized protein n=1 Tax=Kiloniella antarctica TaxID=1550907 RepID=A0ABW5BN82_9PROT
MKYRNSRWFLVLISIVIAFLLSPDLWIYMVQGHEGDSFYTLIGFQRAGLILITIIFSYLLLFLGTSKSHFLYNLKTEIIFQKYTLPLIDLFGAFGLLYLFVWLSPQVYYFYYYFIFNDLPLQIIIKDGPSIDEIWALFALDESQTLSQHGQGFWGRTLVTQIALYRLVIYTTFQEVK